MIDESNWGEFAAAELEASRCPCSYVEGSPRQECPQHGDISWFAAGLSIVREECGRLERENAKLRSQADRDERILAWDAVASHPFFRECYSTDGTLLAAMVDKLNAASQIQAERDRLLATLEAGSLAADDSYRDARKFGHDGSPYFNGGKHMAGIMKRILTTSPTQSLANLQAALVLEYIDSPEHAESLREVKAEVFRGLAEYFGQSGGALTWPDSKLAQMMTEQAAEYRKTEPEAPSA